MANADRLIEVFGEAKARPAGAERERFLATACHDEPELKDQVLALLHAHDGAGDYLQTSMSAATVLLTEKPGDRIGRYKLLEQIGEGGCGVVYMAEQQEPVRRRVALKIIKLGMDTRSVVARFEGERQALALMDHPNIAKVLDGGETGTGRPYFVMELVRGVRITEFCDEARLSTEARLRLFVQVCQAIQHAHQKGIIHRDLKPSNILVTVNDGAPVPKVIDFGVAKAIPSISGLTDKTFFTQFHAFIGTPAYTSPEQAEMSSVDIDTRSDIYSLGVLLYEMLTGRTPFDGEELLRSGLDEMRRILRETEPVHPSTRLSALPLDELTTSARRRLTEPPKLIRLVSGDLDWIVMKALEKDRTRRYETASGLAADIQRHLANEPVTARPPSAGYRFRKLVRRNRLVFAATTAVVAALAAGFGVSSWQFVEKSKAEREQSRLRQAAQRAQANEARLRQQAEAHELVSRRRAYASDMNMVQQSLAVNSLGRAQELLKRQRPQSGELDLRGWEWRYLWQHCQSSSLFTLCQTSNAISSLAASFDGKWVAVGEHDQGGLSIWDLQTRQEVERLNAGNGVVFAAFSPRELLLAFSVDRGASNGIQQSVCLWNGAKIVAELPLSGYCRGVTFSGDGQTLIVSTCSQEASRNQISMWRVSDGTQLASYPAEHDWQDDVPQLAVARDLSVAAHGTQKGHIRVVDLTTGRECWRAESGGEHVIALAFSPEGNILASGAGYSESIIRLWDVGSGQEIGHLTGHRGYVQSLEFSSDGKTLASSSSDQTIRLWDLADPLLSRTLIGHKREVRRLVLLPNSTLLVSGSQDGSVFVWDSAAKRSPFPSSNFKMPENFSSFNRAWRFAPDGESVLAVDRRGRVVQWQGSEFQERTLLFQLGTNLCGARISDDGQLIAAGSADGIVRVWDLTQRKLLQEFAASTGPVGPLQFLDERGRLLVHCPKSEDVHEWDWMARREIRSWHVGRLEAPRWNAGCAQDGNWLFTADAVGHVVLRDLRVHPFGTRRLDIAEAAGADLSPDGKFVAAASYAGFVRVWETETLRQISTLGDFLQGVSSVTFSPDGRRLVTGSDGSESVRLWDMESQEAVLTLGSRGSQFSSTVFSADGNLLGAENSRRVVSVWRAPSWAEINATENPKRAGP